MAVPSDKTSKNNNHVLRTALTLEDVAVRIVVEHQQVGALDFGYFKGGVIPRFIWDPQDGKHEVIRNVQLGDMRPLYDPACPRNFGAVVPSARQCGMNMPTAYSFYTRARLRYACVAAIVQFQDGVIPKLKEEHGITKLPLGKLTASAASKNVDQNTVVTLADFEFFEIHYVPHQRHSFFVQDESTGGRIRKDTIENFRFGDYANHSVLVCPTTGILLDLTMGQVTGKMKPCIFASKKDYEAAFPGRILKWIHVTDKEYTRQVCNLVFQSGAQLKSPDLPPVPFGARVVRRLLEDPTPFCGLCLGVEPSSCMKSCAGCRSVYYCSRECQSIHWKQEHKKVCKKMAANGKVAASSSGSGKK